MAKLTRDLQAMEKRLASTPRRHVYVRAQLCRKLIRLKIKVSQAIREIPFSSAKWTTFGSAFQRAVEEISALETELKKYEPKRKESAVRELRRKIRETEAEAGSTMLRDAPLPERSATRRDGGREGQAGAGRG